MNGKAARMLRRMNANDKKSKRLWKSLTQQQRGRVFATYNSYENKLEGAKEAVVTLVEVLSGRKINRDLDLKEVSINE